MEALSERTGDSTTWVNPNGSLTTDVASGTVRVKENGQWKRIDTALVDTGRRNSQDLWIKSVAVVSLTQLATGVSADASGSSGLGKQGEDGGCGQGLDGFALEPVGS
ncbi:hypothetical protein ACFWNT_46875, partial [Streptomyces sp. NPDC058409]|uniref:hypothetical protein n=1 Tax=Streptomyces sp. NPDC058409 TaxID=3346484 RepID=UPI00366264FD